MNEDEFKEELKRIMAGIDSVFSDAKMNLVFLAIGNPLTTEGGFILAEDLALSPYQMGKMLFRLFCLYCVQQKIDANEAMPEFARALDEYLNDIETRH